MKTWKRNAIIAGVLVLVCAGIYLNWVHGSAAPDLTDSLDADTIYTFEVASYFGAMKKAVKPPTNTAPTINATNSQIALAFR